MRLTITRVIGGQTWSPDGWESASFTPRVSITAHPIEAGSEVTDHAQKLPEEFTIRAWVTETPMDVPNPLAIEQAVSFLEGSIGQLLNVTIPGEGQFLNCLIAGYSHTRTLRGGRTFDISFRQVKIAQSISVQIPARVPAPDAADGAADSADAGKQPTTPTTPTAGDASLLAGVSTLLGF